MEVVVVVLTTVVEVLLREMVHLLVKVVLVKLVLNLILLVHTVMMEDQLQVAASLRTTLLAEVAVELVEMEAMEPLLL